MSSAHGVSGQPAPRWSNRRNQAFHILAGGVRYRGLGADWFQRRRPDAHARRLAHQIEALGYHVSIEPADAA